MNTPHQTCEKALDPVEANSSTEKCAEQFKYENTTLDQLFQEELDRLANHHVKLTILRKKIPITLLSKTRKELAEMGLDFQVWYALR